MANQTNKDAKSYKNSPETIKEATLNQINLDSHRKFKGKRDKREKLRNEKFQGHVRLSGKELLANKANNAHPSDPSTVDKQYEQQNYITSNKFLKRSTERQRTFASNEINVISVELDVDVEMTESTKQGLIQDHSPSILFQNAWLTCIFFAFFLLISIGFICFLLYFITSKFYCLPQVDSSTNKSTSQFFRSLIRARNRAREVRRFSHQSSGRYSISDCVNGRGEDEFSVRSFDAKPAILVPEAPKIELSRRTSLKSHMDLEMTKSQQREFLKPIFNSQEKKRTKERADSKIIKTTHQPTNHKVELTTSHLKYYSRLKSSRFMNFDDMNLSTIIEASMPPTQNASLQNSVKSLAKGGRDSNRSSKSKVVTRLSSKRSSLQKQEEQEEQEEVSQQDQINLNFTKSKRTKPTLNRSKSTPVENNISITFDDYGDSLSKKRLSIKSTSKGFEFESSGISREDNLKVVFERSKSERRGRGWVERQRGLKVADDCDDVSLTIRRNRSITF